MTANGAPARRSNPTLGVSQDPIDEAEPEACARASELNAGSLLVSRYRIEEASAIGGSGTIYRAGQRLQNRPVVVKVVRDFSSEKRLDFIGQELRALARVNQPGDPGCRNPR